LFEQRAPATWQYYVNPWWRERRNFVTRLSRDECRHVLTETTTRFLGRRVGRTVFSPADFTLRRLTFFRNDMKPYAYVRLAGSTSGDTLVRVTLSGSLFFRYFQIVWYVLIALISIGTLASLAGQNRPAMTSDLAVYLAILAAFPFSLTVFGRTLARGDRAFLLGFLTDELQLRQAPPASIPVTA
jgi:hypothetical protein